MLRKSAQWEIDQLLKTRGLPGFHVLVARLDKILTDTNFLNLIKVGKFNELKYAVHKGNWYLDESVLRDGYETQKAIVWFLLSEVEVPHDLKNKLLEEMDNNKKHGYPIL